MKVCFFTKISKEDIKHLEYNQWFKNDLDILKELGIEIVISTNSKELPKRCDFFYSWFATASILPLIKAKLYKKPIIIGGVGSEVVHLEDPTSEFGFFSRPFYTRLIIKVCLRLADRVLAISQSSFKEIKELGAKNPLMVYLGVKTDIFRSYNKNNKDIILTIGHLHQKSIERKRILTILQSVPYVKEVFPEQKFVIAGKKENGVTILEREIDKLGISDNLSLPGSISNKQKIEYLSRALIYVQPSLHEAFGMTIAEAMSCGIPVITSRKAAITEIVGDAGFYIDDPYDPGELAEKIIMLIKNKELRKEIGQKARKRIIEHFSYEKRREELRIIINDLLEKK